MLYGGGYVLLAFLRSDFVVRLGWLTEKQLIDAVAIGQVTPGPLFTTATFIGYILAGVPGAILSTVGIFLPSFFFVAISNRFIPKMRQSIWFSEFLNGVNAASIGLMAAVTIQLAKAVFVDLTSVILAITLTYSGRFHKDKRNLDHPRCGGFWICPILDRRLRAFHLISIPIRFLWLN